MARRPDDLASDSLDMLLDTICNMFGAIIFIALLLCVMGHMAGPPRERDADPSASTARADAETSAERVRALTAELARLDTAVGRLRIGLSSEASVAGAAEDRRREEEERRTTRKAELDKEHADLSAERDDRFARRKESADAAAAIRRQLEETRAEVRRVSTRLHALPPPTASKVARLPRLRPTDQKAFFVVLKWNRIFPVWRVDADGDWVPNRRDMRIEANAEARETRYEPREGEGLATPPSRELDDLSEQLRRRNLYVAFSVCPDSFETFYAVRDYFVRKGLSYNWTPQGRDEPLVLIPSTSRHTVQ